MQALKVRLAELRVGQAGHSDASEEPPADVDPTAQDSEDEGDLADPVVLKRKYHLVLSNPSGLSLQITTWPVRVTGHSDYLLSSLRGTASNFHGSVPPSGTVSVDAEFKVGAMRGPKSLDPRTRSAWIYFDIVKPDKSSVHLQIYVSLTRSGIHQALLGRTDLDSTDKDPMPSGELGTVEIIGNDIKFVVGEELSNERNVVDDRMKKGLKEIPGKGIETNSYVSTALGRASLVVGNEARYHEYEAPALPSRLSTVRTSKHKLEGLASRYIGAFVQHNDTSVFDGHVKVHPVTGVAKGHGFDSTADMTAIFKDGITINYGFHDAGEGRHDQVYVYLTPDRQNWIGDLIASNPGWRQTLFSRLALPAAHDSGMIYGPPLDAGLALLIQQGHLGNAITNHAESSMAAPVVHAFVSLLEEIKLRPERVIANIALTQKDTISDQLRIGVRFFDFRPGFCFADVINAKKGKIHHQHAMVPGCGYIEFLTDVLIFLGTHPAEFVMVEIKKDGFVISKDKLTKDGTIAVYSMVPSVEEFAQCLEEARKACPDESGRNIIIAGVEDLDRPIGELLDENKRFIMIDKVHEEIAWLRADSYDHKGYNTDDPAPIIACLEKTFQESSKPEAKRPGIPLRGAIYQLQATPTANLKEDLRASITYSDSSSLLTYMKPKMDRATYPWVASHTFEDPGNVVFLDDFVEGVLVEHCIEISRQRAGL